MHPAHQANIAIHNTIKPINQLNKHNDSITKQPKKLKTQGTREVPATSATKEARQGQARRTGKVLGEQNSERWLCRVLLGVQVLCSASRWVCSVYWLLARRTDHDGHSDDGFWPLARRAEGCVRRATRCSELKMAKSRAERERTRFRRKLEEM